MAVSGPIVSQSGAGFVGAGQLVPVPAGRTDAAVASAGTSAATLAQMDFLTGRLSTELGHSAPNRPIQTGTHGLVFTTTAPLVSVGIGAGVDGWRSASTPVDISKFPDLYPMPQRTLSVGVMAPRSLEVQFRVC